MIRKLIILCVAVSAISLSSLACGQRSSDKNRAEGVDQDTASPTGDEPDGSTDNGSRNDGSTDNGGSNNGNTGNPQQVWLDPDTGYHWQNPGANDEYTWSDAQTYCTNLTLAGHNDWSVPTISQLRSLIRDCAGTKTDGACPAADDCRSTDCFNGQCVGCGPKNDNDAEDGACYWDHSLVEKCGSFWSASSDTVNTKIGWYVNFLKGEILRAQPDGRRLMVRCVRDG